MKVVLKEFEELPMQTFSTIPRKFQVKKWDGREGTESERCRRFRHLKETASEAVFGISGVAFALGSVGTGT